MPMYLIPTAACSDLIAITTPEVLISQAMFLKSLESPEFPRPSSGPLPRFPNWVMDFCLSHASRGWISRIRTLARYPEPLWACLSTHRHGGAPLPRKTATSGLPRVHEKYGTVMCYRLENVMHGRIRMRPAPDAAQGERKRYTVSDLRVLSPAALDAQNTLQTIDFNMDRVAP